MKSLLKAIMALFVISQVASAAGPQWETPFLHGYGPIKYYKNAPNQPNKNKEYNLIVRITTPKTRHGIEAKLFLMARLTNMLRMGGVPQNHIHMVGVIFGPATKIALNDRAYQKRFLTNNPNLGVMKALVKHGVKFFVCDQALNEHHIKQHGEVNKYVVKTLAGYVAILNYMQKGYLLVQ